MRVVVNWLSNVALFKPHQAKPLHMINLDELVSYPPPDILGDDWLYSMFHTICAEYLQRALETLLSRFERDQPVYSCSAPQAQRPMFLVIPRFNCKTPNLWQHNGSIMHVPWATMTNELLPSCYKSPIPCHQTERSQWSFGYATDSGVTMYHR